MQTTINSDLTFTGTGLHSGQPARMVVHPAPAGHGIVFRRTDLPGQPLIPARWDQVEPSALCTLLRGPGGESVSTVEHIMAALAGTGVVNALIDIDGPEVPILDGSAARFVAAVIKAGLRPQAAELEMIRILKPVEVTRGAARARLIPSDIFEMSFEIDFADAAIGHQHKALTLSNGSFVRELSDCRTFCSQTDVETMQANGLIQGGTYENAVVFDGDEVLSPGGLRRPDEPVRHKMLDALGDLYMGSAPIIGRYEGFRAGHALTNQLLRALFADPTAWRREICDRETLRQLPGVGVAQHDLPLSA